LLSIVSVKQLKTVCSNNNNNNNNNKDGQKTKGEKIGLINLHKIYIHKYNNINISIIYKQKKEREKRIGKK